MYSFPRKIINTFFEEKMQYTEFPPSKYFLRALKTCPKSAYLYTQIWRNKDKHMKILTEKEDIRKQYLVSPTIFRNLLEPLMMLNLVSFTENEGRFRIEFVGQNLND